MTLATTALSIDEARVHEILAEVFTMTNDWQKSATVAHGRDATALIHL
ncbi:MAG: hypothetical protein KJO36_03445 [Acidimicrobiia bacterium]|nr:hypothetical protein [Acidimicrobiia bacterium]